MVPQKFLLHMLSGFDGETLWLVLKQTVLKAYYSFCQAGWSVGRVSEFLCSDEQVLQNGKHMDCHV